jgi:hypothetical protein
VDQLLDLVSFAILEGDLDLVFVLLGLLDGEDVL